MVVLVLVKVQVDLTYLGNECAHHEVSCPWRIYEALTSLVSFFLTRTPELKDTSEIRILFGAAGKSGWICRGRIDVLSIPWKEIWVSRFMLVSSNMIPPPFPGGRQDAGQSQPGWKEVGDSFIYDVNHAIHSQDGVIPSLEKLVLDLWDTHNDRAEKQKRKTFNSTSFTLMDKFYYFQSQHVSTRVVVTHLRLTWTRTTSFLAKSTVKDATYKFYCIVL